MPKLNWIVASIHNLGLEELRDPDVEKCTHLWLQVAKDPRVNVIAHSGDPNFAYDYDRVIQNSEQITSWWKSTTTLLTPESGIFPTAQRSLWPARNTACPRVVNSDAHFEAQVGNFSHALRMLEEIDFPEELILNASEKRLNDYLRAYTNIFETRPY